jgi:hypothetical protein
MHLTWRAVVLALSLTIAPLAAEAQPAGKVWRIGFLGLATAALYERQIEGLRRGLREHGYIEGRNVTIEFRWAEGQYDRLPALAAEIVRLNVDVIITHGTLGTLVMVSMAGRPFHVAVTPGHFHVATAKRRLPLELPRPVSLPSPCPIPEPGRRS